MERDVINTCNFFEAIMGNSRENSFIILDAQGTIVDCNKGVFNAYGYLPEDLSGRHFSVLFTDQDREDGKPQRELKKALLEGSASDYNYLKHKDGRLIWTQGETILAAGNNGSSFFVKSIVDINRQKDLEKYLEESELNEVILESIQDPLVAVDRNMRIVKANSAFYEVFCIDPKDSKAVDFFNAINNLQGNVAELKELFDKNLPESFSVEDVEAEYNFPSKGKRILSILISKINFGAESLKRIIV
ncbi:MAG: PAS domain-containing protein, partial [Cytophagaceae bacterium]